MCQFKDFETKVEYERVTDSHVKSVLKEKNRLSPHVTQGTPREGVKEVLSCIRVQESLNTRV